MDTAVQSYGTSHCHPEGYAGRIEVVTGATGRRRWPEHVKAQIVLESYRDGLSVADVARKHGMSAPQLHSWRRAAREGLLPMPEDDALGLVSVLVSDDRDGGGDARPTEDDGLGLEVCGVRILVPPAFDADHLGRVIAAIRAAA